MLHEPIEKQRGDYCLSTRLRNGRVLNLRDTKTWGDVSIESLLYNFIRGAATTPIDPMSSNFAYTVGQRVLIGSYLAEDDYSPRNALAWMLSSVPHIFMGTANAGLLNDHPTLVNIRHEICTELGIRFGIEGRDIAGNPFIHAIQSELTLIELRDLHSNSTSSVPEANPDVIIARMQPHDVAAQLIFRFNTLLKSLGYDVQLNAEVADDGASVFNVDPRIEEYTMAKAMGLI